MLILNIEYGFEIFEDLHINILSVVKEYLESISSSPSLLSTPSTEQASRLVMKVRTPLE